VPLKELRITGGASRNSTWNQIQADVCNIPVIKGKIEEATALGAAILAGVGVGVYKNIQKAAEEMVHVEEQKEPQSKTVAIYDKYFAIYNQLYPILQKHDKNKTFSLKKKKKGLFYNRANLR
jgi:xylulokinase